MIIVIHLMESLFAYCVYVSNTLPDPAEENPLESRLDVISDVLGHCPQIAFLYLAGVGKRWREAWIAIGSEKETSVRQTTATQSRTAWILGDEDFKYVARRLGGIYCLLAEAGNLGGLMAVVREDGFQPKTFMALEVARRAAKGGHLEVLEWTRAQGRPLHPSITSEAPAGGHLEILQWARANECLWDERACAKAAENGRLNFLQWARANGCPWDVVTYRAAAKAGQ